jgi:hypothetical protein
VHRWLSAAAVLALFAVALAAAWLAFSPLHAPPAAPPLNPRLTPHNCGLVKEGMSRRQVEAILGPPGHYQSRPGAGRPEVYDHRLPDGRTLLQWDGDDVNMRVLVKPGPRGDEKWGGAVEEVRCVVRWRERVGMVDGLRQWWRRWYHGRGR